MYLYTTTKNYQKPNISVSVCTILPTPYQQHWCYSQPDTGTCQYMCMLC